MYYEEKIIDGELHWRNDPKGSWKRCSHRELTSRITALREEKAQYKISAVYLPDIGEAEITVEDIETTDIIFLTFPIKSERGEKLARIVPPCTYHKATSV